MTQLEKNISLEDNNVFDLNINELLPNIIDNVVISMYEGYHTVFLPMNMMGISFRAWYRGKGGVFSKDVKNYSMGKPTGKYILVKNENSTFIARIISEDEMELFSTLKLVDGKIKDTSYMIFKHLARGQKYNDIESYVNIQIPIEELSLETEQLDDKPIKNISLFKD